MLPVFLFLSPVIAEDPTPSGLQVDQPEFDWGHVFQSETVEHAFTIKNPGKKTIQITRVKSGGQETVIGRECKKSLGPGQTTSILMRINTARMKKKNRYTTTATVHTEQGSIRLVMTGNVTQVLDWEPRRITISGPDKTEIHGKAQIFVPDPSVRTQLVSVKSKRGLVLVDDIRELESARRWELRLEATPQGASRLRDVVDVKLRVSDMKILTIPIPVMARSQPPISFSPRNTITFNKSDTNLLLEPGHSTSKDVTVKTVNAGDRFEIKKVELLELPEGVFEATVVEVSPGEEYRVRVTILEYQYRRYLRGKLRITTDHPSLPTVNLRVFARFDEHPNPGKGE